MDLDRLNAQLRNDEGVRHTIYKDTRGIPTLAIGHNLLDPISDAAVNQIFADDVNEKIADLDRELPWWRNLTDARQNAIINMAFNLGVEGLRGFTTFLSLLQSGDYQGAADDLAATKWATQVGARADRIRNLIETGEFDG